MEGNNPEAAIAALAGNEEMQVKNAKYYVEEYLNRSRTVIEFVEK